jgi:hypothetical protein
MIIMVGAAATHAINGEMQRVNGPLMYFGLLGVVAWLRRPRRPASSPTPAAVS